MTNDNDYEEPELDELTSVKITKRSLKWIHRLKTVYERMTGRTFSIDGVIYSGISFADWIYARDRKETWKEYDEYRKEVEEKMAEDKDSAIHGLYEEFEAFASKIVPIVPEDEKKKEQGEKNGER